MKLKRILMTEADSSPGGGGVPAPVEPQAQADAPITMSALKELLGTLKSEIVTEAKNGVHADLRRSGAFKKNGDPPSGTSAPATPPQNPPEGSAPASTGLSMADVESMLDLQDVVSTRRAEYKLTDAQTRRMKASLTGVPREQFATEADAFLSDLNLAKSTAQPSTASQAAPAIPTGPAQPPISDKGSPAPGGVLDWEREYAENPIGMSSAARQRMDAKYGPEKARRMRVEAAQRQAEGIKVERPKG